MILPILAFGAPVLRDKCQEISADYPNLKQFIDDMFETMYQAGGVGLAAPQVNKTIRIFVIDTTPFAEENKITPLKEVFINPKIKNESGKEWFFQEGCLSIPEVREDIVRKFEIEIEYFDANFNQQRKKMDGVTARVIQHEYDHIEGILFTDKLSPLRKRVLKRKLNDISKGKVEVNYKMRFLRR